MKLDPTPHGLFRAEQLRPGDPYELSGGHVIQCLPTGARGSKAENAGAKALSFDPDVEDLGIDTGYSPTPDTLRAPDLSIGKIPDAPGWVKGVPRLAVEYADTGQDEKDLAAKISELLAAGTELVWVVRLTGPRRVEVHHRSGEAPRIAEPGGTLLAPGILRHPVPVEALYDMKVADAVAFRNLLERHGYRSLEEVRAEGHVAGKAEGRAEGKAEGRAEGKAEGRSEGELEALRTALLAVLAARGLEVSGENRDVVASCGEPARLRRWLEAAATASTVADVFEGPTLATA